jgi:hypothetical protein
VDEWWSVCEAERVWEKQRGRVVERVRSGACVGEAETTSGGVCAKRSVCGRSREGEWWSVCEAGRVGEAERAREGVSE